MNGTTAEIVSFEFLARRARDLGVADILWRGAFIHGPDDAELWVADGEVAVEVEEGDFYLASVGANCGDLTIRRYGSVAELAAAHWDYGDEDGHTDVKVIRRGFQYLAERKPPRCVRAYKNVTKERPGERQELNGFVLCLEDGPSLHFDGEHVDMVKVDCHPAGWAPTSTFWVGSQWLEVDLSIG